MAGDRALVYLTGTGIVYEWEVTDDRWPSEEWRFGCGVKYVRSFEPAISCAELKDAFSKADWPAPHTNFRGFKSVLIPEAVASRIRSM